MKLWRMKDKIRRVPGSDQDVYKRSFGRRNSKLCDYGRNRHSVRMKIRDIDDEPK